MAIACWPWGAYLGDDALTKGITMKISSWTRHDHNTMPPASKTTGNYVNSSLAKVEALKAGYDEALMLNPQGFVSECTGENVFVARHGKFLTPPLAAGALEGITQDSVMTIARDLGYGVRRRSSIARSDLYIADEMFVCGTAAEVSAVNSVDDRAIPCPGPMTTAIGEEYGRAVRGQVDRYKDWVEHVGRRGRLRRRRRACAPARRDPGLPKAVEIFDTTLRDGTQFEGISLTVDDKLRIAEQLDQLGVHLDRGRLAGRQPQGHRVLRPRAAELQARHGHCWWPSVPPVGPSGKVDVDPTLRNLLDARHLRGVHRGQELGLPRD